MEVINLVSSLATIIASITVIVGVLIALRQMSINRKQLHFSTIERCIESFRRMENLHNSNEKEVFQYVDLVSEELFYFQHMYLPKIIALEWLDGMIDYVPIVDWKGKIINSNNCVALFANRRELFLKNYPRLIKAFTVRNDYDFDLLNVDEINNRELVSTTRMKIAEEIYQNVLNYKF